MVRVEVLRRRLNKLDEYLEILTGLGMYSPEEFLPSPERYGSAERFLQLAIEALIDMGSHVVADLGLGVVDTYGDIPVLLQQAGYIDHTMQETWIRMIGFETFLFTITWMWIARSCIG